MSNTIPTGFFAYSSKSPTLAEAIRNAVDKINGSQQVILKTWENCNVTGKLIIDVICDEIRKCNFFCADLTGMNPNVMFELGYAIAVNKPVWLLLDTSFLESNKQFEQLQILTTVGYVKCTNSEDIVHNFYKDQPYLCVQKTLFDQSIRPHLSPAIRETILYLKSRHDNEASIHLSNRIQSVENIHIPLIVDNPRESSVNSLTWYGAQVYAADGIFCHFTSPEREGARLHNARHALVAGMALGMGKRLLMLEEGDFLAPIDYRERFRHYRTAAEAVQYLEEWLKPLEESLRQKQVSQQTYASTVKLATELKGLQIGEYIAENEADRLINDYFVETASFREAREGRHTIFVGRRGSGKTANLLKLSSELGKDRRNLVCVIKPVAYELQALVELLRRYKERDLKGYAVESLWKFLLYTEIADAVVHDAQQRTLAAWSEDEFALVELLKREQGILGKEFSVRLERCVEALVNVQMKGSEHQTLEGSRIAISEAMHQGILIELRTILGRILANKNRVAILVDNLDQAWDRHSDLPLLAEFLLGLLGAAQSVSADFRHKDSHRQPVNVNIVIFLRSDIFYKMKEAAREPDKIQFSRLLWNDKEVLLRVIEERFVASHGRNVQPAEMWARYFCPIVKGIPVKDYLATQILSRPRDLLFFVKAAIDIAVNRHHPVVQENDILEAEKQYSQYAFSSILVENGITIQTLESILYEFVGSSPCLTYDQIKNYLGKAGISDNLVDHVIDHLCSLTFLGIEVNPNDFRFAEDPDEHRRNTALARRLSEKRGGSISYMVNRAFWAFLEIS